MAKIIAFSGKAGSGKDTAANLLKEDFPEITHLSFAAPLKEMSSHYFPSCDVVKKDPYSREILQGLGSFVREQVHEDYWVDKLIAQIEDKPDALYVITDLRYKNEYTALRFLSPQHEVYIIRLEGRRYEQSDKAMSHPSETDLDTVRFTNVYNNTGTLEMLHSYLKETLHEIYSRK